jgi:predicted nucleic-acid-binding protein
VVAVDTNVLVRFLVRDDEAQFKRATAFFEQAQQADEPVFVSDLVLVYLVWVLRRAYRVGKAEVVRTLTDLVRARHVQLESTTLVERAITAYTRGRGDFADYIVRERARLAGCDNIATFDEALLSESGFVGL